MSTKEKPQEKPQTLSKAAVKKSWLDLIAFTQACSRRSGFNTKIGISISEITDQILKLQDTRTSEYDKRLEKLKVDHCSVDEITGNILRDASGNRCYTKENEMLVFTKTQDLNAEFNKRIYDIEPCICNSADIPENLTDHEIKHMRGLIIPEDYTRPVRE